MEPCNECILRVMCINKRWQDTIDDCDLICDYLCENASVERSKEHPWADMIYIKSLNKTFSVAAYYNKDVGRLHYAIGEYWNTNIFTNRKKTDIKKGYKEGEYDEVRVVIPTDEHPPTMLMKKYTRKKDGSKHNRTKK
jgi:hypothetical protein